MASMQRKSRQSKKSEYRLQLEAEVKPMMMEANMKLLNLEQMAKDPEYADIEKFAYRKAMQAIKEIRGKEYKRFNIPKNTHQLEKTKRALEDFLESPTSSKKGIIELYEKNAASLNEKMGSKWSWQKVGSFLQAAEFEDIKAEYDSDIAVIMIKLLYKHRRKTGKKKFIEMLEKHQFKKEGLDEVDSDTLADFVKSNIKWTDLR